MTCYIIRHQSLSHAPFVMVKCDDKSTPLLHSGISNNERPECEFNYCRIDKIAEASGKDPQHLSDRGMDILRTKNVRKQRQNKKLPVT